MSCDVIFECISVQGMISVRALISISAEESFDIETIAIGKINKPDAYLTELSIQRPELAVRARARVRSSDY